MVKAATDHRERLLAALTEVLAMRAYRDVTLTDITSAAKVSRRTFYEHFANKDECLLALSAETSVRMMNTLLASFSPTDAWEMLVQQVTAAYLGFIRNEPSLMQALYIETCTMGMAGLKARRRVAELFAAFLVQQVTIRQQRGELHSGIDQASAIAIVAGVNELILHHLMDDRADDLPQLAPVAGGIILRLTGTRVAP